MIKDLVHYAINKIDIECKIQLQKGLKQEAI